MFGIELTAFAELKMTASLAFAGLVWVAFRLGRRHRREQEQEAELDNRFRNTFRPGVADRAGDRTSELLKDIRQD